MPIDIELDQLPAGYTVESVKGPGTVRVQVLEFTSSADGQHFIQRIEGFPEEILRKVDAKKPILRSQVDHLLAVIRRDRRATVYLNELPIKTRVRVSRAMNAGEAVFKDDIIDIAEMEFGDVHVSDDAGVVVLFSVGWRKGLFYDLGPLSGTKLPREFDLRSVFAGMYSQVFFQERFAILDSEWGALFRAQWFPFAGLKNDTIGKMLSHVRSGWNLDEFLERAVDRFTADDYMSSAGLLYPRIEGILRSHHAATEANHPATQKALSASAVAPAAVRPWCILLPHRFERYLNEVYFASFNPDDPTIAASRNSVGHGVASAALLNAKSAAIAILVVHQLFYCTGAIEEAAATPQPSAPHEGPQIG